MVEIKSFPVYASSEEIDLLDRAAAAEKQSRSSFLLKAGLEKAKAVTGED